MKFQLRAKSTQISFTHVGLVPEVECYDMCVKGWDQYVKGSLFKLITEGTGQPQKKRQAASKKKNNDQPKLQGSKLHSSH